MSCPATLPLELALIFNYSSYAIITTIQEYTKEVACQCTLLRIKTPEANLYAACMNYFVHHSSS